MSKPSLPTEHGEAFQRIRKGAAVFGLELTYADYMLLNQKIWNRQEEGYKYLEVWDTQQGGVWAVLFHGEWVAARYGACHILEFVNPSILAPYRDRVLHYRDEIATSAYGVTKFEAIQNHKWLNFNYAEWVDHCEAIRLQTDRARLLERNGNLETWAVFKPDSRSGRTLWHAFEWDISARLIVQILPNRVLEKHGIEHKGA